MCVVQFHGRESTTIVGRHVRKPYLNYWGNFAKMRNYKIKKTELCVVTFGGLESPKVKKFFVKNRQIPIFGFQCVTNYIEG